MLIAHYERMGDVVLAMLADDTDPRAADDNAGRRAHREWVEEVFADRLPEPTTARSRLVDVLVVATDVYAWKPCGWTAGCPSTTSSDRMMLMTETLLTATAPRMQPGEA